MNFKTIDVRGTGQTLKVYGNGSLILPKGKTIERPAHNNNPDHDERPIVQEEVGMIRYNIEHGFIEFYSPSLDTWKPLGVSEDTGSIIDQDQDTYISTEDNPPGTNNNSIRFFTLGKERLTIRENGIMDQKSSNGFVLPKGTTEEQPEHENGLIRFNTDKKMFEVSLENDWMGFSAVVSNGAKTTLMDYDKDTFITPEDSPSGNENELKFYTNGEKRLILRNDGILSQNTTNGFVVSNGTTSEQPSHENGLLRYNSEKQMFEISIEGDWLGLASVVSNGSKTTLMDYDKDTFIITEDSPTNNDNTIKFYTNGNKQGQFDNDGRFILNSGSESNPIISFYGNENTGIFHPSTDQVGFSTNGTLRTYISESGMILPSETETYDVGSDSLKYRNVYADKLKLNSGGIDNPSITFRSSDNNTGLYSENENQVSITTDGYEALRVSSPGNNENTLTEVLGEFNVSGKTTFNNDLDMNGNNITGVNDLSVNGTTGFNSDINMNGNDILDVGEMHGLASRARYGDLAEKFKSDSIYPVGTVVIFGGDEEITTSNKENDTRIAGIISNNPAYAMSSNMGDDKTHPYVALSGRVYCYVKGEVNKGDILINSDKNGIAKSSNDPKLGSIVAKSLENKNDNEIKLIEVCIT